MSVAARVSQEMGVKLGHEVCSLISISDDQMFQIVLYAISDES